VTGRSDDPVNENLPIPHLFRVRPIIGSPDHPMPVTPSGSLSNPKATLALSLGLLVFTAAVLFFAGLGRLPLLEPDEGRNAEVGREMLVSGDWITPHYNALAYLDKPAVYFWMVAASLKTFGVSEGVARLPSALMAVATMLLVWFLARRMFRESAARCAGIVFATSPLAIALARQVNFDMALTFFITLAMTAFWLAEERNFQAPWFDVLMFAAMGVGVITKGPVAILLPLISVLLYQAMRSRWRKSAAPACADGGKSRSALHLRWGWGFLIFLAVALPWFVAVSLRHPDFPRYAFWNESLKRFATSTARRGGGIFYYVPVFLAGFFPWSFFLLGAGWNRLRRWRELKEDQGRPILLLLCWAACVFGLFTVSHSKLPTYFLPAIVPLSILMGAAWLDVGTEAQSVSRGTPDWLKAGFALVLGAGVLVAAASHSWLFSSLHARLARRLPPSVLDLVQPSLLYTGLILAAEGFLGRKIAAQMRGRAVAITTFVFAALIVPTLVVRWYRPLKLFAEEDSSRRLAATILASPELRDSPVFGYYYFRTSLPFYLRHPVGLLSIEWGEMTSNYQVAFQAEARRTAGGGALTGAENVGARHPVAQSLRAAGHGVPVQGSGPQGGPPGRGVLVTLPEFRALAKSSAQPILVLTPNPLVEDLWRNAGRIDPLWNGWDFSIWEIPPANAGSKRQ
jgi:4-amino-4-deoxy-L-arabinose transferase-like glycosyltransferase